MNQVIAVQLVLQCRLRKLCGTVLAILGLLGLGVLDSMLSPTFSPDARTG